jgi:replicative DNA helicase
MKKVINEKENNVNACELPQDQQKSIPATLFSEEMEKTIVRIGLTDFDALGECWGIINEEDFYFLENKRIFEVFEEAWRKGESTDVVKVANKLRKTRKGGFTEYLAEIMDNFDCPSDPMFYFEKLKELSVLRELFEVTCEIQENIHKFPTDHLLAFSEKRIRIVRKREENEMLSFSENQMRLKSLYRSLADNELPF